MPKTSDHGLNLFLDILLKLEELDIPYVIIGGFAATIYGITRATFNIHIVDLEEKHIQEPIRGVSLSPLLRRSAPNAKRDTNRQLL